MAQDETLAAWAAEWMATTVHLKPRTRLSYDTVLRHRLLPAFGEVPVAEITQRDVKRFVAALVEAGDAPGTVHRAYELLRNVLNGAYDAGLIAANPCRRVRLPRSPHHEMHFLDPPEVLALSRAIHPRFRLMILFAAYTGARAGEIGALRVKRLDLDKRSVDIRESLADVNGHLVFGSTKTHSSRKVGLPSFLVEELTEHIEGRGLGTDDLVFSSVRRKPIRHNAFLVHYFRPAVTRAGLPAGLRFHDLRHTCVALLIAQGAHPRAIMERLGHSTIEMTLGRYGHLFPGLDAELVAGLDAMFRQAGWGRSLHVGYT
ncbi:MAG TPA: site-specific integrase [Acidimicrobiales bacterium]|nr:site-specific integrase [Acidimicrobiales bacterium]